jgi:cell division protein FtsB
VQFVSPNAPLPASNSPGAAISTRGQMSDAPLRVVPNPESRARPEKNKHGAKKSASEDAKKKGAG